MVAGHLSDRLQAVFRSDAQEPPLDGPRQPTVGSGVFLIPSRFKPGQMDSNTWGLVSNFNCWRRKDSQCGEPFGSVSGAGS